MDFHANHVFPIETTTEGVPDEGGVAPLAGLSVGRSSLLDLPGLPDTLVDLGGKERNDPFPDRDPDDPSQSEDVADMIASMLSQKLRPMQSPDGDPQEAVDGAPLEEMLDEIESSTAQDAPAPADDSAFGILPSEVAPPPPPPPPPAPAADDAAPAPPTEEAAPPPPAPAPPTEEAAPPPPAPAEAAPPAGEKPGGAADRIQAKLDEFNKMMQSLYSKNQT